MEMHRVRVIHIYLMLLILIGCQSGNPEKGKVLFESRGCSYCHSIGSGKKQGPDLKNVIQRYDRDELRLWLTDPEIVYKQKSRRPLNRGYSPMPRVILQEEEIEDLVAFLSSNPKSN
jgi:protein SCO1/2